MNRADVKKALKQHLAKAGSVKTRAKAEAARKNGKLGGRPKVVHLMGEGKHFTMCSLFPGVVHKVSVTRDASLATCKVCLRGIK